MATVAYISNTDFRHCTESHVVWALRELGHTVFLQQENRVTIPQIERAATGADLLLFTRTWGCHDPRELSAMFRRVEQAGTVTAAYHLDLYVGLERESTIRDDPFWGMQWTFSPDGDPEHETWFTEQGIRHVFSPPCVHAPDCAPGRFTARFAHDVVFVGSYPYAHGEWSHRNHLIEHLSHEYGGRFHRYGAGGETVRNGLNGPRDRQLNDLYATAKVVVGDSLCPDYKLRNYHSDRLPETLGRGGILVFPRVPGLDLLGYQEYEHYLPYGFGEWGEVDARVTWALSYPDEARAMAERARQFVRTHHTFTHRMRFLLDTVGVA